MIWHDMTISSMNIDESSQCFDFGFSARLDSSRIIVPCGADPLTFRWRLRTDRGMMLVGWKNRGTLVEKPKVDHEHSAMNWCDYMLRYHDVTMLMYDVYIYIWTTYINICYSGSMFITDPITHHCRTTYAHFVLRTGQPSLPSASGSGDNGRRQLSVRENRTVPEMWLMKNLVASDHWSLPNAGAQKQLQKIAGEQEIKLKSNKNK